MSFKGLALEPEEARHFLSRTHFSVDQKDLLELKQMNRLQAVEWLFEKEGKARVPVAPYWIENYKNIRKHMFHLKKAQKQTSDENILALKNEVKSMLAPIEHFIPRNFKNKLMRDIQTDDPKLLKKLLNKIGRRLLSIDLQNWWFEQMVKTPAPLSEKMTLFWHNHFPSSIEKVRDLSFMYEQNNLIRRNALGNFNVLLNEISKDPAMLIYLDGDKNVKKKPNENFGREVMELFTLGEGHYSEQDIKEAARAFTGGGVNRQEQKFVFRAGRHDKGDKVFLGQKGKWRGDDILRIILEQKQVAAFISNKIWKYFAGVEASEKLKEKLASNFFQSGYELKSLLKEILIADEFYASKGEIIKSPVDLMVGAVQEFKIESDQYYAFVTEMSKLGQSLFNPPNVKGWPGGKYWINSASLVQRKSFLNRLVRVAEKKMSGNKKGKLQMKGMMQMNVQIDMENWLSQFKSLEIMLQTMLPIKPYHSIKGKEGSELILAVLLDPTYQLR